MCYRSTVLVKHEVLGRNFLFCGLVWRPVHYPRRGGDAPYRQERGEESEVLVNEERDVNAGRDNGRADERLGDQSA
jgi:hypothetical protein